MEQNYIVEKGELLELLASYHKLCALEAGGVNNWNYYDLSMTDYDTDKRLDFDELALDSLATYKKLDGTITKAKKNIRKQKVEIEYPDDSLYDE